MSGSEVPDKLPPLTIRAEMARRGLLHVQRQPYEDAHTGQMVYPERDPQTIAEAFQFLRWLELRCTQEADQ